MKNFIWVLFFLLCANVLANGAETINGRLMTNFGDSSNSLTDFAFLTEHGSIIPISLDENFKEKSILRKFSGEQLSLHGNFVDYNSSEEFDLIQFSIPMLSEDLQLGAEQVIGELIGKLVQDYEDSSGKTYAYGLLTERGIVDLKDAFEKMNEENLHLIQSFTDSTFLLQVVYDVKKTAAMDSGDMEGYRRGNPSLPQVTKNILNRIINIALPVQRVELEGIIDFKLSGAEDKDRINVAEFEVTNSIGVTRTIRMNHDFIRGYSGNKKKRVLINSVVLLDKGREILFGSDIQYLEE